MKKEEILEKVGFDLERARQIHAWLQEKTENTPVANADDTQPVVSPFEHNGEKYVRVHTGKYDFCIDLHEAPDEMNWDDAMKYASDKGMRLFTLEEGLLMFAFKDEINATMKELGGDPLNEGSTHWSSAEYSRGSARLVFFNNGNAYVNSKSYGYVVRPVAAFTCVS